MSRSAPTIGDRAAPMGWALAGVRLQILDGALAPVPAGAIGELYVGGEQVGRGYRDAPGLTAARFVADPRREGERMYRTGDLVRRDKEGRLVFVRRADGVVKLRGFRVSPATIEAATVTCEGVVAAAAVIDDDGVELFCVPLAGSSFNTEAIGRRLAEVLAPHERPRRIMAVEALQTTVSGKVDRRALVHTLAPTSAAQPPVDPPSLVMERSDALLADVREAMCVVLDRQDLDADEDFFAAGGHSLRAMRLVARLAEATGRDLHVRDVFAAPTPRALAAVLAERPHAAWTPVRVAGGATQSPATSSQRRLWFLSKYDPGDSAYNMTIALALEEELDEGALRLAVGDLVARHQGLRTSFPERDGEPVNDVRAPGPAGRDAAGAVIVEHVSPERLEEEASRVARAPFDLTSAASLRVAAFRLPGPRTVVLLVTHHIVADGWSIGLIRADLARAYSARRLGNDPFGGSPASGFADLVPALLDQEERALARLPMTVEDLAGAPAEITLPRDWPRPPRRSGVGGSVASNLDRSKWLAATARAKQLGVTRADVFFAAVGLALRELGAGEDVVLGVPVAGRSAAGAANVVGMFANTAVMRLRGTSSGSIADAVRAAHRSSPLVRGTDTVPFDRLVEAINPPRATSMHPIFQILVSVNDTPLEQVQFGAALAQELHGVAERARFDLSVYLETPELAGTDGPPPRLVVEYDRDLFEESTAYMVGDMIAEAFTALTTLPVETSTREIMLGRVHRDQTRALGTGPRTADADRLRTLHGLVARAAHRNPAAVAVEDRSGKLTYAQLDVESRSLAARLTAAGVVGGDRVGLATSSGPIQLIAMLGILRTGAAYVPLDPSYPRARNAYIVQDAVPTAIVVDSVTADALAEITDSIPLVYADAPTVDVSPRSEPHVPERAAAYVIYTSGSTGRPKGVVVSHAAAVNHVLWAMREYALPTRVRVLLKTPVGFDVSVGEIFVTLAAGATLVVSSSLTSFDPARIARELSDEVDTAFFVPSVLADVIEAGIKMPRLRQVVACGEALPPATAVALAALTDATLHNAYGPTEAAVAVTSCAVRNPAAAVRLPIGVPGDNTDVLVLDDRLAHVPRGVVGELYIAGRQLADGYLGRPGLTATRFTARPDGAAGETMYRTGDLARWSNEGLLEFVGRADEQVKVHGVRVELGEVEWVAYRLDGVVNAAAALRDTPTGESAIVLFLEVFVEQFPGIDAVHAVLREALPTVMLPARIVVLDPMPRLPNGKIDRAGLPDVDFSGSRARRAPESVSEGILFDLVAEAVGHNRFGIDDPFFELGGDSVAAVRLVSNAREHGLELSISDVFAAPTVHALAALATGREGSKADEVGPDEWDFGDFEMVEQRDGADAGSLP